jgi:hypothetical protein
MAIAVRYTVLRAPDRQGADATQYRSPVEGSSRQTSTRVAFAREAFHVKR